MDGPARNTERQTPDPENAQRLIEYYDAAVESINILYEAAVAGHDGAEEVLRNLADKLTTRGGDWLQMKYLKK